MLKIRNVGQTQALEAATAKRAVAGDLSDRFYASSRLRKSHFPSRVWNIIRQCKQDEEGELKTQSQLRAHLAAKTVEDHEGVLRGMVFARGDAQHGEVDDHGRTRFYTHYDALSLNVAADGTPAYPKWNQAVQTVANELRARGAFEDEAARARNGQAIARARAEAEREAEKKKDAEQMHIVYIETGKGGRQPHCTTGAGGN